MARKISGPTALLRSICALFLVVCILFFVFPHAHDHGEGDCPFCVLKSVFSEILLTVCTFGILRILVYLVGICTHPLEQTAPQTLVQLKVKLSD